MSGCCLHKEQSRRAITLTTELQEDTSHCRVWCTWGWLSPWGSACLVRVLLAKGRWGQSHVHRNGVAYSFSTSQNTFRRRILNINIANAMPANGHDREPPPCTSYPHYTFRLRSILISSSNLFLIFERKIFKRTDTKILYRFINTSNIINIPQFLYPNNTINWRCYGHNNNNNNFHL